MPKISQRPTRQTAVLKGELLAGTGYSRKLVDVNIVAGMDIGAVLYDAGSQWELVAVANTADAAAVLIDDNVDTSTTGVQTLAVVYDGAIVNAANLIMAADIDTDAEKEAVYAALDKVGIRAMSGKANVA